MPSTGEAACCYDTTVSESRIAGHVGIEKGELPPRHYYGTLRAFNACFAETQPLGVTRSYLGEPVFEGALPYAGMRITPSWGGSMFEARMPTLFVPEERWGPGSWGVNHPLWVRAPIHHGLTEARYGLLGLLARQRAGGRLRRLRRRRHRVGPGGYTSNEQRTLIDHGFPGCSPERRRCPTRRRRPTPTAS